MKKYVLFAAMMLTLCATTAAADRDEIRVVGSPDVLPYVQRVAQNFSLISGFAVPSLEVTGTGTGYRLFCDGIGFEYPDINAASRRITIAEFAICQSNGVNGITEIVVGLDGIVLANSKAAKQFNFTKSHIYQAVAADLVRNGQIVKNTSLTWREIDPALPIVKIKLMGPPPSSGTYDAFVELIMEAGCRDFSKNSINGIAPTVEYIANNRYSLVRPIFLYVKTKHVDAVRGLQKFLYEFTSEHAIGPDGYLAEKGFIPLDARGRNSARDSALSLTPIAN